MASPIQHHTMAINPLVSVIIPLWNRERLIGEALASVCGQSFRNLEILVVDDGSNDGGPALVAAWGRQDARVRLICRDRLPKGAPECRNLGLERATGEYVIFLDSDDLLGVDAVERRVAMLEAHPEYGFVVAQGLIFQQTPGDQQVLWNRCDYGIEDLVLRFLDQDMPWATGGPTWRRAVFETMANWNSELCSFQDWELHARACLSSIQVGVISAPDFYIRWSESDRISLNHFALPHVKSRVSALESVWAALGANRRRRRKIRHHVRGYLLRNQLQLLDHGHGEMCGLFNQSIPGKSLISLLDRWLLAWIARKGPDWHWNTRVRKVAGLVWGSLPYDSFRPTGFLNTLWTGKLPPVAIHGRTAAR